MKRGRARTRHEAYARRQQPFGVRAGGKFALNW